MNDEQVETRIVNELESNPDFRLHVANRLIALAEIIQDAEVWTKADIDQASDFLGTLEGSRQTDVLGDGLHIIRKLQDLIPSTN